MVLFDTLEEDFTILKKYKAQFSSQVKMES